MEPLQIDFASVRDSARAQVLDGAMTGAYRGDRKKVVEVLNSVLANELVCALRYKNHYYLVQGIEGQTVAEELLEHAKEEMAHADAVALRIRQLGGDPEMDPAVIADRSHCEFKAPKNWREIIRENVIAERIAVQTYSQIVRWLGNKDPTSRRLMERLLEKEEEHADELADLLARLPKQDDHSK